jgi:hypothetical protein
MTRRLTREEGILAGGSSGSALVAALRVAEEVDDPEALVVVLLPDTGRNYLSKIFNEEWMRSNGFLEQFPTHSVGDVVGNVEGQRKLPAFIGVQARDSVRSAIDTMQNFGISQLPVLEGDAVALATAHMSGGWLAQSRSERCSTASTATRAWSSPPSGRPWTRRFRRFRAERTLTTRSTCSSAARQPSWCWTGSNPWA